MTSPDLDAPSVEELLAVADRVEGHLLSPRGCGWNSIGLEVLCSGQVSVFSLACVA
jgi:hypothetical protein